MSKAVVLALCFANLVKAHLIPVSPLYSGSSWDPDVEFSRLSASVALGDLSSFDPVQLRIAFCNHYAVNSGSVMYSPCGVTYLVAAHRNGIILPPNACGGFSCPTAGGTLVQRENVEKCDEFRDYTSLRHIISGTSIYDHYCYTSGRCKRSSSSTLSGLKPAFQVSPPIFTVATNWCDESRVENPKNVYPAYTTFAGVSIPSTSFCPADISGGYSDTPVILNFLGNRIEFYSEFLLLLHTSAKV